MKSSSYRFLGWANRRIRTQSDYSASTAFRKFVSANSKPKTPGQLQENSCFKHTPSPGTVDPRCRPNDCIQTLRVVPVIGWRKTAKHHFVDTRRFRQHGAYRRQSQVGRRFERLAIDAGADAGESDTRQTMLRRQFQ